MITVSELIKQLSTLEDQDAEILVYAENYAYAVEGVPQEKRWITKEGKVLFDQPLGEVETKKQGFCYIIR